MQKRFASPSSDELELPLAAAPPRRRCQRQPQRKNSSSLDARDTSNELRQVQTNVERNLLEAQGVANATAASGWQGHQRQRAP